MIQLNKKEYLDKLHACWIGKNISGTLGNKSYVEAELKKVIDAMKKNQ